MRSKYLSGIPIRVDLTVEGVMTTSYKLWVSPSHHSPNDMTPLPTDVMSHDRGNLDHQTHNKLVFVETTRDLIVYLPHVY